MNLESYEINIDMFFIDNVLPITFFKAKFPDKKKGREPSCTPWPKLHCHAFLLPANKYDAHCLKILLLEIIWLYYFADNNSFIFWIRV